MKFKENKKFNFFKDLNIINSFNKVDIIYDLIKTIEKYDMLSSGDCVLISISGGPDSVFLTHVFNLIKNKYNLKLYAFHLDHLTRNGQSTKDAAFVSDLCKKYSITLFSEKIDVKRWCTEKKINFQEGARLLRKSLLEKYSNENAINKIAIAHNADDNLETFFMNLIRGAGLRGLSAIKPVSGKIIRPLLYIFKKDITDFLISNNISFCVDRTNLESKYFRNKIRNRLIPFMESEFGEGFKNNIVKAIENLKLANDYVDKEIIEIFKKQNISVQDIAEVIYNKGFIKFPILNIINSDDFLKTALIFKLIELVKGSLKDITLENITDILKFCYQKGENKKINLSDGIFFVKEGDFIYFYDGKKVNLNSLFISGKNFGDDDFSKENKNIFDDGIIVISEDDARSLLAGEKIFKGNLSSKNKDEIENKEKNNKETKRGYKEKNKEENKEKYKEDNNEPDLRTDLTILNNNIKPDNDIKPKNSIKSENNLKPILISEINKTINELDAKINIKVLNIINYDKKFFTQAEKNEAYMDINSIKFPVVVRNWHAGDSFIPLGLNGEKKLQDFFIDSGITFHLRKKIFVFCDLEKIIWVGNLRIDDRVKVSEKTKTILYLRLT
ncbi:MAG: tRNA lysidine(34) synthetase TilS [Actinobacteria bacterium]|nr:tRNA lysidine(34) synthetase TilS [Cyanobacteriota bacterium]MCL5771619.1 tRNA lysidine(34) synthetase TilS [Actinomycetota bacterium]